MRVGEREEPIYYPNLAHKTIEKMSSVWIRCNFSGMQCWHNNYYDEFENLEAAQFGSVQ